MLDPHIAGLMEALGAQGFRMPDPFEAGAMRALLDNALPAPPVEVAEVRDLTIPLDGATIGARLYRNAEGALPLVVFYHGGGWVHGTLDTHDRLARAIARDAECAVLSVDYRLAPEHPFPAARDDALGAAEWAIDNADALKIDPARVAVAGDSAGGNLAATVSQAFAESDRAPFRYQLLFYPVTDGRGDSESANRATVGFLSPAQRRWYWDQYAPGDARLDPGASPALGVISPTLAPATIVLAGNDPLHDEGVAYAEALKEAGVAVALHDYPTAVHGFVSLFGLIPIADEALDKAVAELRSALAR